MKLGVKLVNDDSLSVVKGINNGICKRKVFDGSLGLIPVECKGNIINLPSLIIVLLVVTDNAIVYLGDILYAKIGIPCKVDDSLT